MSSSNVSSHKGEAIRNGIRFQDEADSFGRLSLFLASSAMQSVALSSARKTSGSDADTVSFCQSMSTPECMFRLDKITKPCDLTVL